MENRKAGDTMIRDLQVSETRPMNRRGIEIRIKFFIDENDAMKIQNWHLFFRDHADELGEGLSRISRPGAV